MIKKILFLSIVFFLSCSISYADCPSGVCYVAPQPLSGDCTSGDPCKVTTASNTATAGDFIVMDTDAGIYDHADDRIAVVNSGTSGNPITYIGENSYSAYPVPYYGTDVPEIDADYSHMPLYINNEDWIDIIGITFRNSNDNVAYIGDSSNINIRTSSFYDSDPTDPAPGNSAISSYYTDDLLVEDVVLVGTFRNGISTFGSGSVTLRRVFIEWEGFDESHLVGGDNWCSQFYDTINSIAENVICVMHPTADDVDRGGINTWENYTYNNDAEQNKILASIVRDAQGMWAFYDAAKDRITENNRYEHVVAIDHNNGFNQKGDNSGYYDHMTLIAIDSSAEQFFLREFANATHEAGYLVGGVLKNSSFVGGNVAMAKDSDPLIGTLTHTYNNLYDPATIFSGDISGHSTEYCDDGGGGCDSVAINPVYDTGTYGEGAYLFVPSALQGQGDSGADIGAQVLYKYVDGVKQAVTEANRLWPWLMEARVCAELSRSVTYSDNGSGCTGGFWPEDFNFDALYSTFEGSSARRSILIN